MSRSSHCRARGSGKGSHPSSILQYPCVLLFLDFRRVMTRHKQGSASGQVDGRERRIGGARAYSAACRNGRRASGAGSQKK